MKKNYFYNFCHDLFYDTPKNKGNNIVKHFERNNNGNEKWTYTIKIKEDKEYTLDVEAINLNLYSTGVGILAFHLSNTKYHKKEDILKINQFGRRIFPPFYNDIAERIETPVSLALKLGSKEFEEETYNYNPTDHNKPAKFLSDLIKEAVGESITLSQDSQNSSVGVDDRMYVLSWYYNPRLVKRFHPNNQSLGVDYNKLESEALSAFMKSKDFWYQFVFVDGQYESCQNAEMKERLLEEATYKRWAKCGSLYGISRYSMVMLSNGTGNEEHLYRTMNTMYARMAEIVLVQRASMLRFSSEISDINKTYTSKKLNTLYKHVNSLNKSYIKFINMMLPLEVTAQDQGIEMYDMLHKQLRIREMKATLADEIATLHEYVSLQKDKRNSQLSLNLAIAAAVIAVATMIAQFMPINWTHEWAINHCYVIGTIIIPLVLCVLFYWFSRIKNK